MAGKGRCGNGGISVVPEMVVLDFVVFPEGDAGYEPVAASALEMLAKAGWPAKAAAETAGSPWYRKWWFWTLLAAAAAGLAVGIGGGGGGGSSTSSTGTIGVNF